MRIAYASNSVIPSRKANSVHVIKMCHALAQHGHEVELLIPKRSAESDQDWSKFYGVPASFQIKRVGLRVKGLLRYCFAVGAVLYARRMRADLFYSRSLLAAAIGVRMGLRTAFELHQPPEDSEKFGAALFRSLLRSKNLLRLVFITRALEIDCSTKFQMSGVTSTIAPDASDPVRPGTIPISKQAGRLHVGYVGHLYAGRGVEIILSLARALPDMTFHFVGGDEKDISARRRESADLRNVVFHGFVSPSECDAYRIAFDVLLAPYQATVAISGGHGDTARWMSPLKIFEYMAAAKPIVASDLPVLKEVLKHGHNALLCAPADFEAWKSALERLAKDADLSQKLATSALADFHEKYTWSSRAKLVLGDRAVLPNHR